MVSARPPAWRLGEIMLQNGWISWSSLDEALSAQKEIGGRIGNILIRKGFVTSEIVARALAEQVQIPYVDIKILPPQPAALVAMPKQLAYQHHVIPLVRKGEILIVAVSDPLEEWLMDKLCQATKCREIRMVLTYPELIDEAIYRYYGPEGIAA